MYYWPHRKKLRRKNYDYSQNWYYFVTICCYKNQCFFGDIIDWKMILNEYGEMAKIFFNTISEHFKNSYSDSFVIMPNHVHWIIIINKWHNDVGYADLHTLQNWQNWNQNIQWQERTKMLLSKIIHWFKSSFTRKIRSKHNDYIFAWQRSFYDVIIKTEEQLEKSRQYILSNPRNWDLDVNNPDNEERVKELKKQGKR